MRSEPSPTRSRTRGQRTATGPMPVMILRSGKCPWRTSRWWPLSVDSSAYLLSKVATSASIACARSARAPSRNTSVSGINKTSWLGKLENVSLGHGVSLLCWRSGGVEHPHDTPPYPFMPSPTFVHSSLTFQVLFNRSVFGGRNLQDLGANASWLGNARRKEDSALCLKL